MIKLHKLLSILVFACIVISTNAGALQLDVVQNSIAFSKNAEPITIQLRVLQNGKPQRWDSAKLRAFSSHIIVKDSNGRSLGQGSDTGLSFVPNGTSEDRVFYNLVGVVDRKITTDKKIFAFVSIRDNPELSDMVSVSIPKLMKGNNNFGESNLSYLTETTFKESISALESTVTNTVWAVVLGPILALITFFLVLRKSDKVTEDIGGEIKDKQLESHFELATQGKDILQVSKRIKLDTDDLRKITNRIDDDIRDFSKNPEKHSSQIKKDLVKLKRLVKNLESDSTLNNDELSDWILSMEKERVISDDKVEELVATVNFFVGHVDEYHKAVISMRDYVYNLEAINYKERREEMLQVVNTALVEKKLVSPVN